MKKLSAMLLLCLSMIGNAQTDIQWQKRFGGLGIDQATCIIQTSDGGYAVVGPTASNDSVVYGNHGNNDYLFYKLDSNGNQKWHRWYGSSGDDIPKSIVQTTDGGYLLAGFTSANNGDVSGNHGSNDVWLLKTNSVGFIEWQQCYGGSNDDGLNQYSVNWYYSVPAGISLIKTLDGGSIFATTTMSNNGEVSGNHGGYDYWVVKVNNLGAIQWQKCYGGENYDIATSIIQNTDGTYVVAGYSASDSGQVTGLHYSCYNDPNWGLICNPDYWIIKIDTLGNLIWEKSYGGIGDEYAYSIAATHDGGYIVAGYTDYQSGDVTGMLGYQNYWLVKLNAMGNLSWEKCYGGSQDERAMAVVTTADGGYFVVGNSYSHDLEVTNHHDTLYDADIWAIRLDTAGNLLWQRSFGGTGEDNAYSVIRTADNGFAIAGFTNSNDGDVTPANTGTDFWVIKLNNDVSTHDLKNENFSVILYPNPFHSTATLSIKGATPQTMTLKIYNLLGQEISSTSFFVDRNKDITIAKDNLPAGFYFYKLLDSQNSNIANGKVIIQ